MHLLTDYLLFLAKSLTFVFAGLALLGGILVLINKEKDRPKDKLEVEKLNDKYESMAETLNAEILSKDSFKKYLKGLKKLQKKHDKAKKARKRIFVIDFLGDVKATGVHALREEITAILTIATEKDEIIIRLESNGGLVSSYGLAASQLQRIKDKGVPLTVAVDEVAASGGYLMACVADKIIAAPFAIIGSIGVLAQLPNFHRLLKKHEIDFEQITAGEYKRTLTMFGENTEKGRKKFQKEIQEVHDLFKDFVSQNRTSLDVKQVATGEYWLGSKALELGLVDELITSDDYLSKASLAADIYTVAYSCKLSLSDKIAANLQTAIERTMSAWQNVTQKAETLF